MKTLSHVIYIYIARRIKIFCITLLLLLASNLAQAADYYWVKGTGNWSDFANHWATSSGGSTFATAAPTADDNVFFDANSFTSTSQSYVSIDIEAFCKNMDWTGATYTPSLGSSGSATLHISGSLNFIDGMKISFNPYGAVYFNSAVTGNTITTAGKKFGCTIYFDGTGDWTLLDSLTSTSQIYFNQGHIITNNKNITCSYFIVNSLNGKRTLDLGNSTITCNRWSIKDTTNFTLNAGTSTINMINFSSWLPDGFTGGSLHYYNLNTAYADELYIGGSNTFNTINIASNSGLEMEVGSTQTVNNITGSGVCDNLISLYSTETGQQAYIKAASGTITLSYANLKDISASGGATFNAESSIAGNVTGWNINDLAGRKLYWIGGSGNWGDVNHWSLTSGGTSVICKPNEADTVIFDNNSFSANGQTVTVNVTANFKVMDWSPMSAYTSIKFQGTNRYINCYGSLILCNNVDVSGYTFRLCFCGSNSGVINTFGKTLLCEVYFQGSGSCTLQSDFIMDNYKNLYFNEGRLNTAGFNLTTTGQFRSRDTKSKRILDLGASTITVAYWYFMDSTQLKIIPGTSTIKPTLGDFRGASQCYNNVIINSSQFSAYGSNTFNTLTLNNAKEIAFEGGGTQTITTLNCPDGTCANLVSLSSTSVVPATFKMASGVFTKNYLNISNIKATGGATFIANNSVGTGDVSGWIITETANDQNITVCEDITESGSHAGVNLTLLDSAINGGTANPVTWFMDEELSIPVATPVNITVTNGQKLYANVTSDTCSNMAIVTYTVNSLPAPDLGKDSTILTIQTMILNPGTFASYLWNDATTNPTQTVDGSVTGQGEFKYSVTVKDANGCANNDSVTVTVKLPNSIALNASSEVKLFPNPSNGIMYLEFTGELNDALIIKVVNIEGQEVLANTIQQPKSGNQYKLDLSSFAKGIYMLHLSNSSVYKSLKVVIK